MVPRIINRNYIGKLVDIQLKCQFTDPERKKNYWTSEPSIHVQMLFYTRVTVHRITVFGRPFVKRFTLRYRTVVCPALSVCDVLWLNDRADQDAT